MLARNYAENTAKSNVNCVFYVWDRRGEEIFWKVVHADDSTFKEILLDTFQNYPPLRLWSVDHLSHYKTSFKHFREFFRDNHMMD